MATKKTASTRLNNTMRWKIMQHAAVHLCDPAMLQDMAQAREEAERELIQFFTDRSLNDGSVAEPIFDAYAVEMVDVTRISLPVAVEDGLSPQMRDLRVAEDQRGRLFICTDGHYFNKTWDIKLPRALRLPKLYGWIMRLAGDGPSTYVLSIERNDPKFGKLPMHLSVDMTPILSTLQAAYGIGHNFESYRMELLHQLLVFVKRCTTVEEVLEYYGHATTALASDEADKDKALVTSLDRVTLDKIKSLTVRAS